MLASDSGWDLFLTIQPLGHEKRSTHMSLDAQTLDPLAPFSDLSTSLRQLGTPQGLRVQGCKCCTCSTRYTTSFTGTRPAGNPHRRRRGMPGLQGGRQLSGC